MNFEYIPEKLYLLALVEIVAFQGDASSALGYGFRNVSGKQKFRIISVP